MTDQCPDRNRPPRSAPEFLPNRQYAVHHDDLHTIRNLQNCMCYLWTKDNGNNWVYPTEFDNEYLYGHIWDGEKWNSTRIPLNLIEAYF